MNTSKLKRGKVALYDYSRVVREIVRMSEIHKESGSLFRGHSGSYGNDW